MPTVKHRSDDPLGVFPLIAKLEIANTLNRFLLISMGTYLHMDYTGSKKSIFIYN